MSRLIGLDVYGTLFNPLAMEQSLQTLVGQAAGQFAAVWRQKQLEYAFRRGLMRKYENFDICTQQAMVFAMESVNITLTEQQQADLMAQYLELPIFPDAQPGLTALQEQGHTLVAFSNGLEASLRTLLANGKLLPYLTDVVSVDDVKSFKPDPAVYAYFVDRLGNDLPRTWFVSSNPWDIIGAKSAGLQTVWLKRSSDQRFDPWGIEPDMVATDLVDMARQFGS